MSENEMSQQERDAAEVQRMRDGLATFGAFAPEYYRAAIHTIDRQAAEIDRLRAINAEYAALATEYQNSDMGENELAERICGIRDRAALASTERDGAE